MAEDQGCCAGQGRAATISVLVLSIIVFFLNIVAMLYALQINAYYWIMAYHLAGTVCVLTATSVYACKCCGEGGFPLRRLGQVMFMYAACCGVVCLVVVLSVKHQAIADNCAETIECDVRIRVPAEGECSKPNREFYQCINKDDDALTILDDNTCGSGKMYCPKWQPHGCHDDDELCLAFCTKKACIDYCRPWSEDDADQCSDRHDCFTFTQYIEMYTIPWCVAAVVILLVPALALAGSAVAAKEPERVRPGLTLEMREMPPIVAAVAIPAGMQPYQAYPGQPPQMVPAAAVAGAAPPVEAKVISEEGAMVL